MPPDKPQTRERRARRLINKHWSAVSAVATALMARGVLSEHEVVALVAAASSGFSEGEPVGAGQ